jgi:hypothetical protein
MPAEFIADHIADRMLAVLSVIHIADRIPAAYAPVHTALEKVVGYQQNLLLSL